MLRLLVADTLNIKFWNATKFLFTSLDVLYHSEKFQDELETHSKPESISIFVHYGGGRANDPKVMAEYDVVLTTYGVLSAAYKNVRKYLRNYSFFPMVLLPSSHFENQY